MTQKFGFTGLAILGLALLIPAGASQAGRLSKDWDFAIGTGVWVQPTYEGSDAYEVLPLPIIDIQWKDRIFLSVQDGLGWNAYKTRNFRTGPLLDYAWGSDDRPTGINDIDPAIRAGAFAEFAFDHWKFDVKALYGLTGDSEGLLANAGAAFGVKIEKDWSVVVRADTTFRNENDMKTHFGINQREASDSGLASFSPGLGISDVGLGVHLNYRFSKSWSARAMIRGSQFVSDAADSPLTKEDFQLQGIAGVAYHF